MTKNINNIMPNKTYFNVLINKFNIYKDNQGKSGIYRWTNLINDKSYVGSAVKLNRRLSDYYCIDKFKRIRIKGRSLISNAILKYKINNFNLDILEYCEPNIIIEREQYYLDLLKPEYNICKIAGSSLGRKLSKEARINIGMRNKNNPSMLNKHHTNDTKLLLSALRKGPKNPMYGKHHTKETKLKIKMSVIKTIQIKGSYKNSMLGKHHSDETIKKISESNKLYKKYNKMSLETKLKLSLTSKGINVIIFDDFNNFIKEFYSIKATSDYFNISPKTLHKILRNNLSWRGLTFKFEIKSCQKIRIFNSNHKLIEILDNGMTLSKLYNIPRTTVYRYLNTGKLYKNKYYFNKIDN